MTKRKRRWRGERRRKSPVVTLASQASSSLLIGDNIDFDDNIDFGDNIDFDDNMIDDAF